MDVYVSTKNLKKVFNGMMKAEEGKNMTCSVEDAMFTALDVIQAEADINGVFIASCSEGKQYEADIIDVGKVSYFKPAEKLNNKE